MRIQPPPTSPPPKGKRPMAWTTVWCQGWAAGAGGAGHGGVNGDGRTPDLGSEHTAQCTDDVRWDCAPETCITVLTSVTPIHPIKRKNPITFSITMCCLLLRKGVSVFARVPKNIPNKNGGSN